MQPNGRTVEVTEEEVVRTPRSVTAKQPLETDKKNEKVSLGAYKTLKRMAYKNDAISQNCTYSPSLPPRPRSSSFKKN